MFTARCLTPSVVGRCALLGFLVGCGGFPADKVDLYALDLDQDGFPQTDEAGLLVDCDDTNAEIYPGAAESCDGLDNDCDGSVDGPPGKGVDARTRWWPDSDGDGYGDSRQPSTRACEAPVGMTDNNGDCDDLDASSSPDGSEVCDGADNDCNGEADDNASDASTWYIDRDGDGFGDAEAATDVRCTSPEGSWAMELGDCNDGDASIFPTQVESCDGEDNDCDGDIDEEPGLDASPGGIQVWADSDGDGFGDPDTETTICAPIEAPWIDDDNTDCDDSDASAYPGSTATEVPFDGVDQDCDSNDFCTDLDCDGIADLVVPWYDSELSEVLLSSAVSFNTEQLDLVDDLVGAAFAGDVNGDGYPDVVLGIADGGADARLYYGPFSSADARDEPTLLPSQGAGHIAAGDFDGDGRLDLALGGIVDVTSVEVFYADDIDSGGAAPFSATTTAVLDLLVADLDQDGFDDLAFCQEPSLAGARLVIYRGSSDGLMIDDDAVADAHAEDLSNCTDIEAANLDGEGPLELVLARNADSTGASLTSHWAKEDGGSYVVGGDFEVAAAASVQLVDLDGDSLLDVVFGTDYAEDTSTWATELAVYMGTDDGFSDAIELNGQGAAQPLVADFDGDGLLDILAPGQASDTGAAVVTYLYRWDDAGNFADEVTSLSWGAWVHGAVVNTNPSEMDSFLDLLRFDEDPRDGLVRHQGSGSGPIGSGTPLLSGSAISPPIVVE